MRGRFDLLGWREILQRRGPDFSRQPVNTGMPCESLTITSARVNVTVQSASHSGPTPIKVCLNPGMIYHVTRKSQGSLGVFNSPVPAEISVFPVAVPTAAEIPFEGFDIATVFLKLIVEGEMSFLAGG